MSELLIASNPSELVESQNKLITSVNLKIGLAMEEARGAKEMVETMIAQRLGVSLAKRMHRRATSRVSYLLKIKAALEAGFVMMPDIDGDIVAVRTDRTDPSPAAKRMRRASYKFGATTAVPDETAPGLPPGEGQYVSPRQLITTSHRTVKDKQDRDQDEYTAWAIKLRDPDGLDRRFIRPQVISRTAGAMTMRIFDEIVAVRPVVTQRRRSRDPIVLGRVIDVAAKTCSAFLIAWFVDPDKDI